MYNVKLFLAPMAGATDSTMRRICVSCGADMTTTEMVSSVAVTYNDKKTFSLARIGPGEGECAVQVFGHDLQTVAYSIARLYDEADIKPASFDINMGCPVKKVTSNNDGSALMRDPQLAGRIVSAAVSASKVPVTVKIRAGWDRANKNAVEVARAVEAAGASRICVHGRCREDMYTQGTVDINIIADVKSAVSIPVIANGDITDANSAKQMLDATGADGIAIGRAALGDPFVFERIKSALTDKPYEEPSVKRRIDTARLHLQGLVAAKGERTGICEARKHMAWYTKGMRGAAVLRQRINAAETVAQMNEILNETEEDNSNND